MERSGLARWLLLGLAVFLLITFLPKLFGKEEAKHQPLKYEGSLEPKTRAPEQLCDIWGDRFRAQLTTRGASLRHFELTTAKYQHGDKPIDLSTTPDVELRRQLSFNWRNAASPADENNPSWQVDYDTFDWKLASSDGKSCVFTYQDAEVALTKTVRSTGRPYELAVQATIENRAKAPRKHALAVHTTAWRTHEEVQGHMFRVSPYVTHVECVSQSGKMTRLAAKDFEPDEFGEPEFAANPLNPGDWFQPPGDAGYAAVSNAYFSHAVIAQESSSGAKPVCQLQIEQRGQPKEPGAGAMYRARLAYPQTELAPGQKASYEVLAYIGPKERDVLSAAAGGNHNLDELIDLGFFAEIAKVLVAFLLFVYGIIPNWGIAIIILTIVARSLLFPLSWPSIKSMVKMRELKPELDALSEKYKDDPQGRGLAQMELWRKHNVNPLKGCLPQLASMPVWFALYTTLQTAVELYNIPFLWFPDLSMPDPFYVLPFIIGGTSFLQQKLMPMQGDPAQQKMMLYFMPAMFTVFMLFLPAGLGVYMFTNGVLGIAQQQIVEWHVRRTTGRDRAGQALARDERGKRSTKQRGGKQEQSEKEDEGPPLLGKGKA